MVCIAEWVRAVVFDGGPFASPSDSLIVTTGVGEGMQFASSVQGPGKLLNSLHCQDNPHNIELFSPNVSGAEVEIPGGRG